MFVSCMFARDSPILDRSWTSCRAHSWPLQAPGVGGRWNYCGRSWPEGAHWIRWSRVSRVSWLWANHDPIWVAKVGSAKETSTQCGGCTTLEWWKVQWVNFVDFAERIFSKKSFSIYLFRWWQGFCLRIWFHDMIWRHHELIFVVVNLMLNVLIVQWLGKEDSVGLSVAWLTAHGHGKAAIAQDLSEPEEMYMGFGRSHFWCKFAKSKYSFNIFNHLWIHVPAISRHIHT